MPAANAINIPAGVVQPSEKGQTMSMLQQRRAWRVTRRHMHEARRLERAAAWRGWNACISEITHPAVELDAEEFGMLWYWFTRLRSAGVRVDPAIIALMTTLMRQMLDADSEDDGTAETPEDETCMGNAYVDSRGNVRLYSDDDYQYPNRPRNGAGVIGGQR